MNRLPAPALFILAALFQYVGAAIAVSLFAVMEPGGVVWWRIFIGALGMILLWRPWTYRWDRRSLTASLLFGLSLGAMNLIFYEAIARIPLGVAVSLEFIGPVAVALLRGKGWLNRCAAIVAFLGVALIGGWGLDLSAPQTRLGFLLGLGAGAAWAAYILMGSKIAQTAPTGPSLGVGTLAASVASAPFLWTQLSSVHSPAAVVEGGSPALAHAASAGGATLVLALIAVGLFSSTVPYSIEALAFARLPAGTFALLTALLPATSTLVGAIMLNQMPAIAELVGLVLISVAVWMASTTPQPRRGNAPSEVALYTGD